MLIWMRLQLSDVGRQRPLGSLARLPRAEANTSGFALSLAPLAPPASSLGLFPGFSWPLCPARWV